MMNMHLELEIVFAIGPKQLSLTANSAPQIIPHYTDDEAAALINMRSFMQPLRWRR
jgi:hypothetical protein